MKKQIGQKAKLSNSNKTNQMIDDNCQSCHTLAKKLRKAESRIINLYIENARLRNSNNLNQQNFNNSVSAINPPTFNERDGLTFNEDITECKNLPELSAVVYFPIFPILKIY